MAVRLELEVRNDDRHPVDDGCADGQGEEVHEDFPREEIGHGHDKERQARAEAERVDRYAAARELLEPLRCVAFFGQAVGDAGIAVNSRVIDGNGRREDDEVEQVRRCREADVGENLDERAVVHGDLVPRPEGHDDDHRADVEDEDTPDNLVNGFRQRLFRIFRFPGGDADEFDAAEREDDRHHGQAEAPAAVGQDAAVVPEVAEILRERARILQDEPGAEENHAQDGGDFDEGHPEFRFTVSPDIDQVQAGNGNQTDQGCQPLGQVGQPVVDIDADGRQFGHADDDVREPVVPAQHEAREGAPVLIGIVTERARDRFFHGHFAEHAHDEKDDDAADQIGRDD